MTSEFCPLGVHPEFKGIHTCCKSGLCKAMDEKKGCTFNWDE